MRQAIASTLLALLVTVPALAQETTKPPTDAAVLPLTNPGFEEGEPGTMTPGWPNKLFTTTTDAPHEGLQCGFLDASKSTRSLVGISQRIDATPWRGKRLRYRAAVKVGESTSRTRVQLWFRIDGAAGSNGRRPAVGFDNMSDRPITNEEWAHHDIVLDVSPEAERMFIGMFIVGQGTAWIDDVSLIEISKDTPTTSSAAGGARSRRPRRDPLVQNALNTADTAPQQPFWTPWLLAALFAMILFIVGMKPARERPSLADPDSATPATPSRLSLLRSFAFRATVVYWLLYALPRTLSSLCFSLDLKWGDVINTRAWGHKISEFTNEAQRTMATWLAEGVFGMEGELVPSKGNGSGDTTESYLTILAFLVIAVVLALIWTAIRRRQSLRAHALGSDALRSFLRYALAFVMLGYGIAKLRLEYNQFGPLGDYHLGRTWGESSPMGVLWSFMGASMTYTMFTGIGEVVGALLLIWRRTATLGAMVTFGVMINVVMLNFCYDVPVKIYSTHLLFMAILILVPDIRRLARVFFLNRPTEAYATASVWDNKVVWWLGLLAKLAVIYFCIGKPLWENGEQSLKVLRERANKAEEAPSKHLLLNRGFRWVNEVPFNR